MLCSLSVCLLITILLEYKKIHFKNIFYNWKLKCDKFVFLNMIMKKTQFDIWLLRNSECY